MQNEIVQPDKLKNNPRNRALDLLAQIKLVTDSVKTSETEMSGTLNRVLLDTVKGLIDDVMNSIGQSEILWQLNTKKLVELLGVLASFPGYKRFLLPFYEIIVDAIHDEIGQNESGDWMDNLSSLQSGYSILRELVLVGGKIPELYGSIRTLIDDPTIYGLEKSDTHIHNGLFQSERGSSGVMQLFTRIGSIVSMVRSNSQVSHAAPDSNQKLKPSREELIKRRLDTIFNIALGAMSIGDETSFRRDMDQYFEYVSRFSKGNPEYFSFKIKDNEELFFKHPFLFKYFRDKVLKFKDPKEVADSLFEVARIHFSQHKDPLFVFDVLEGIAGNLSYGACSDLVRQCLELLITETTAHPLEIQKGIRILGKIHPATNWGVLNLLKVGSFCNQYGFGDLSVEAYALAWSNIGKIEHDDQQIEAKLSLYRMQGLKDKEEVVFGDIESKIEKGPLDDLRDHTYTRIAFLAGEEYGRRGDMAGIVRLKNKITQTHSYPNDHVRDMVLGAIGGMVNVGHYDKIPAVIELIPINLQGSGVNQAVYSLISAGKLELALVSATNRVNHRDVNIISDQPSDLIGRILEASIFRGDNHVSQKCLEALLSFPINEWVVKRVKDAYLRSPHLFTDQYLASFSRHCISNFHAWVRSSHLTEVIKFLQEIHLNRVEGTRDKVKLLADVALGQ